MFYASDPTILSTLILQRTLFLHKRAQETIVYRATSNLIVLNNRARFVILLFTHYGKPCFATWFTFMIPPSGATTARSHEVGKPPRISTHRLGMGFAG